MLLVLSLIFVNETNSIKSFFFFAAIVTLLVVSRHKQIIHLRAVVSTLLKQSKTTTKSFVLDKALT